MKFPSGMNNVSKIVMKAKCQLGLLFKLSHWTSQTFADKKLGYICNCYSINFNAVSDSIRKQNAKKLFSSNLQHPDTPFK